MFLVEALSPMQKTRLCVCLLVLQPLCCDCVRAALPCTVQMSMAQRLVGSLLIARLFQVHGCEFLLEPFCCGICRDTIAALKHKVLALCILFGCQKCS